MIRNVLFGPSRPSIESQRPLLYRIAYAWCHQGALADDLVQEALSKAWTQRAQLRDVAAMKAWTVSIMHRCWIDHLRGQRHFDDVDDWQDVLESTSASPEACCDSAQIVACVRSAVARLPQAQRQVLTLVDLEEFGYAEVAQILDIPVGTVMSRLSRARASLRNMLETPMREAGALPAAGRPALRRVK